jgi:hypothetical protein
MITLYDRFYKRFSNWSLVSPHFRVTFLGKRLARLQIIACRSRHHQKAKTTIMTATTATSIMSIADWAKESARVHALRLAICEWRADPVGGRARAPDQRHCARAQCARLDDGERLLAHPTGHSARHVRLPGFRRLHRLMVQRARRRAARVRAQRRYARRRAEAHGFHSVHY